jgi:hypothetical protein
MRRRCQLNRPHSIPLRVPSVSPRLTFRRRRLLKFRNQTTLFHRRLHAVPHRTLIRRRMQFRIELIGPRTVGWW